MRRGVVAAVAVAAALVAAVPAVQVATAAAPSGTITVTVTAADTKGPVEGVCADAFQAATGATASDCVGPGESATLVLSGLTDGVPATWSLTVPPQTGYLQPQPLQQSATVPAEVRTTLARGALVRGLVMYPDGTRPSFASVALEPADPTRPAPPTTYTDGFARWAAVVPAGDYRVRVTADVSQYVPSAPDADTAQVFQLTAGSTTQLDEVLVSDSTGNPAPGRVSGRVVDAVTGSPVPGVCPVVAQAVDPAPGVASCLLTESHAATGADGGFSVEVLADEFERRLWVVDPRGRYAAGSALFTAPSGTAVEVGDVALAPAAVVTGLAVDAKTKKPLVGVCPTAYVGRTAEVVGQATCSDTTGRWRLGAVPPGDVTVELVHQRSGIGQWVPGVDTQAQATLLAVVGGATRDVGTVVIPEGARLTGQVLDPKGKPVDGAWVVLGEYTSRAGVGEGRWTARTGSDGRYTITDIPRQDEYVTVYAPGKPYAWQFSGGATDPANAQRLAFRYGRTTRFDARLQPEARLSVTVSGAAGTGFSQLDAFTASGAPIGWSVDVEGDGTGVITGLPTSGVKLAIVTDAGGRRFWYDDVAGLTEDAAQADPIPVTSGRTTQVSVTIPPWPAG